MEKKLSVVGIIPARYASERFPGKPLVLIGGKSLIQRTYENANLCSSLEKLYVATDDSRIFDHVKSFGGNVIMTSPDCATGTERLADAVKNHAELQKADIIINVQGDEPLLQPSVIDDVASILKSNPQVAMSTAVVKLTSEEEASRTSVVKCVIDSQQNALYFSRSIIPASKNGKWCPKITYYKHIGIYGYQKDFLLHYLHLTPTPLQLHECLEQLKVLEHGYKIKVAIVDSDSIGVDTPEDKIKIESMLL